MSWSYSAVSLPIRGRCSGERAFVECELRLTKPVSQGKAHACRVATDDYCFSGHGSLSDLQAAWTVLNLVARFRKARMIVEGMFTLSLIPPKGVDKYGKGLAVDFAGLIKDFYNGAYGDSPLQAAPMLHAVAAAFLFTPYGLGKNKVLWGDVSNSKASSPFLALFITERKLSRLFCSAFR